MNCEPVAGTTVPIIETFTDVIFIDGRMQRIFVSPTTVTVNVLSPSGVVSHPTAAEESEGVWRFEIPVDEAGTWRWSIESSGIPTVVRNGVFQAIPQTVP
jgi:hypothetical protein